MRPHRGNVTRGKEGQVYRFVVVEDEPEAAHALLSSLERYAAEHGEEFQTTWLKSALDLAEASRSADLVFLDIELPQINGMDAAAEFRLTDQSTPIIFVTNLAQYAVRGYQVSALDFIVKPFTYFDLALRLDRAMAVIRQNAGRGISIRTREGLRVFPARELVMLETAGHDVVYRLSGGEELSARGSLKSVEAELGGSPFLRVSSSCIINMSHVRGLADGKVTLSDGSTCWISRANKKRCTTEIARFLGGGGA